MAGEPWSDHPQCVCPTLGSFGRTWNDALSDEDRQMLKPYIPRLIGTRTTPDLQDRRAYMAADWAVRTYTPTWLRLINLEEEAAALEALPELVDVHTCRNARPAIEAARQRADAAGAAARDAAWAAAGDAAGAAAAKKLAPA